MSGYLLSNSYIYNVTTIYKPNGDFYDFRYTILSVLKHFLFCHRDVPFYRFYSISYTFIGPLGTMICMLVAIIDAGLAGEKFH